MWREMLTFGEHPLGARHYSFKAEKTVGGKTERVSALMAVSFKDNVLQPRLGASRSS